MSKEDILKKHIAKYYHHKGKLVSDDDILPVSRIKPIIDECNQEYARETNIEKDKEIERLKGLINGQAYSIWKGCDSDMPFDEWNKLFVHGNNL